MERQVANHGNYISSVVSLYKGLGGGWEPTPVDQLIPENVRNTMQERSDWGSLLTAPVPDSPTAPAQVNEDSHDE
jgi:hypothetical protein